jgi:hypothetical protein
VVGIEVAPPALDGAAVAHDGAEPGSRKPATSATAGERGSADPRGWRQIRARGCWRPARVVGGEVPVDQVHLAAAIELRPGRPTADPARGEDPVSLSGGWRVSSSHDALGGALQRTKWNISDDAVSPRGASCDIL